MITRKYIIYENCHQFTLQHSSLLSHSQWLDSNRHTGQMLLPQPTQVLVDLLHAQCLHSLVTIMNLHHHTLVYEL